MAIARREFLALAAGSVAASAWQSSLPTPTVQQPAFQAVAFDAFAIFDPRPIPELAEKLFPARGKELSDAWRTRQFEYQWLRALTGRYADFWRTTEDGLVFAAKQLHLELSPESRAQLMESYLRLKSWPDVPSALLSLRESGVRLALLSNMTAKMLNAGIESAGLVGVFDHVLSTDRIQGYKPEPRAYQMAVDAFGLKREKILFVAFAGWDAAGAKSFGYPTYWVNRLNLPEEEMGVEPDSMGRDLTQLVQFVNAPC